MKRFFKTLTVLYIFFFAWINLAGANSPVKTTAKKEKWESLNGLKNVHSHLMSNGHIVRLEFNKPVSHWVEPVFYEKSVQIDFPKALISPSKKSFSAESFAISKVLATQFDRETLRVRFQIKPEVTGIEDRFKLVSQGRFLVVRFETSEALPSMSAKVLPEKKQKKSFEIMDDDQLSQFLYRATQKMKIKEKEIILKSDSNGYSEKVEKVEPEETGIKVKRAGMGVVPFVDQIKKAALVDSEKDEKRNKSPETKITTKENIEISLKDSIPVGKPIKIIPSGMKMISMFALVLGLMFLVFFGFKKYVLKNTAFGGGNKLVNVLGTWFLGPKKNICLVEVAGEILVLGVSQENITLLSSVTSEAKIEEIKNASGIGRNRVSLNADHAESGNDRPRSVASQASEQFSNYLSKFSKHEKNQDKVAVDTKEQILQKIGKLKTARA
tara:strand:- start:127 stop:1446 length:1320 start_codon:yes stop_codon:yes gene_type:complete